MQEALMLHVARVAKEIEDQGKPYCQSVYFNECGTPACLGGYLCEDPVLQQAGLKRRHRVMEQRGYDMPLFGPDGDEWMGEDALMHLLGLNWNETQFIFGTLAAIRELDPSLTYDEIGTINNTRERIERVMAGEFRPA
jgi:hypothetical protein